MGSATQGWAPGKTNAQAQKGPPNQHYPTNASTHPALQATPSLPPWQAKVPCKTVLVGLMRGGDASQPLLSFPSQL
jgi:hypothetical protein